MQIKTEISLTIPEVKLVTYSRFMDNSGYFSESWRLEKYPLSVVQINESYSHAQTIRGMHLQWNPHMGKLVRCTHGKMVDLILDMRIGSPTLGKILAVDLVGDPSSSTCTWVWIPPGFGHGNFHTECSSLEYLCTGQYSKGNEASICPLAKDIDWSLVSEEHKQQFDAIVANPNMHLSERDQQGMTVEEWTKSEGAKHFVLGDTLNG